MDKMKELYEKVAKESALQVKFDEIMKGAEASGREKTEKELVVFAKEAGYEVSVEEMQEYFKTLSGEIEGTLSDMELDMVAGGKSWFGVGMICLSVVSLGYICLGFSIAVAESMSHECKTLFR